MKGFNRFLFYWNVVLVAARHARHFCVCVSGDCVGYLGGRGKCPRDWNENLMPTYEFPKGCRSCGDPEWNGIIIDGEGYFLDCQECVRKVSEAKRYYHEKHLRLLARKGIK